MANMIAETEAIGKFFFSVWLSGNTDLSAAVPTGGYDYWVGDEGQPKQDHRFCRVRPALPHHYGYFLSKGKWDEKKIMVIPFTQPNIWHSKIRKQLDVVPSLPCLIRHI